jgi:hypothetical protein
LPGEAHDLVLVALGPEPEEPGDHAVEVADGVRVLDGMAEGEGAVASLEDCGGLVLAATVKGDDQ